MKVKDCINSDLRLKVPVGKMTALANDLDISKSVVSRALNGNTYGIKVISEKIRELALTKYGAYPVREVRIRIDK